MINLNITNHFNNAVNGSWAKIVFIKANKITGNIK